MIVCFPSASHVPHGQDKEQHNAFSILDLHNAVKALSASMRQQHKSIDFPTQPFSHHPPKATAQPKMPHPLATAISHAETKTCTLIDKRAKTRTAMFNAQARLFSTIRGLEELRDQAWQRQGDADFLELSINATAMNKESAHKTLQAAQRELQKLQADLKRAKFKEDEARLEIDLYLFSEGKLPDIKPELTSGPLGKWRTEIDKALDSAEFPSEFPEPPPLPEGQTHALSCPDQRREKKERPIKACPCAVEYAFMETGNLRVERLRWLPTKFPLEWSGKVQYIFDVLDNLYKKVPQGDC
jgi:hypothetical protein